jgi:hypothetical protein
MNNNVFPARGIAKPGEGSEPFVKLAFSTKLSTLADRNRPTKIILNGGQAVRQRLAEGRYFDYMWRW